MFELRHVDVTLSGTSILSNVSLSIRAGEFVAVIGPNGAGKSTILKVFAADLAPSSGEALFLDRNLRDWPSAKLAQHRAILSQYQNLAFPFSVGEVVRLGCEGPGAARDAAMLASAVRRCLADFDLLGFESRLYQRLSSGEQQRVHLARVLCQLLASPASGDKFLFLDEPVSSLDIKHQVGALKTAKDLTRQGIGVLAILHDINLAGAFADRVAIICRRRIVADGAPRRVLTSQALSQVFELPVHVRRSFRSESTLVAYW
jgi:iron complex transport system ATP-binding protein